MERIITTGNLRSFAYWNENALAGSPRALVVEFMGLNGLAMYDDDTPRGRILGREGILYCVPYLDPWNWMNPLAVRQTDEIRDALQEKAGWANPLPFVSSGGSMGGLAALVYARYASRTPEACVVNCPVCDLPYHYTERPDLPRTLYAAFGNAGTVTLEEALRAASPLHLAEKGEMPAIPYTVFHCTADRAVNKKKHSDRFVAALRRTAPVTYVPVEGRDHCDLDERALEAYHRAILEAFR